MCKADLFYCCFFFFNDPATTEIYTLSLHDALPISPIPPSRRTPRGTVGDALGDAGRARSEEHTSELQSHSDLVCRLLLEKTTQGPGMARRAVAVCAYRRPVPVAVMVLYVFF